MLKREFVFREVTSDEHTKIINDNDYVLLNFDNDHHTNIHTNNHQICDNLLLKKKNGNKFIALNYYNFMELLNSHQLLVNKVERLEHIITKRKREEHSGERKRYRSNS